MLQAKHALAAAICMYLLPRITAKLGRAIGALIKRNVMETATQKIGSVGQVTENFDKGVASASGSAALPPTNFGLSVGVQVTASLDAKILIGFLAAKIGGPIPAEVAAFLEATLAAT